MTMPQLRVAVIGGAGRVGLPLAVSSAMNGFETVVVDKNSFAVERLRQGIPPFHENGLVECLGQISDRISFEGDTSAISPVDLAFVTVGTPLTEEGKPSSVVDEVCLSTAESVLVGSGVLAIRSTVTCGTTERIAQKVRDSGFETIVVSTPERMLEGHAMTEIPTIPQIVGCDGDVPSSVSRFFGALGPEIVHCRPREAEFAKLITNAYRFVNFALANEFADLCSTSGISFSNVREIVRYQYPRAAGLGGPGFIGGTCLYKDTVQLQSAARQSSIILSAAISSNESLPRRFVEDIETKYGELRGRKVLLLGLSFKPNSDDIRESVSYQLWEELTARGAKVLPVDPNVSERVEPRIIALEIASRDADLAVVATQHDDFCDLNLDVPVFKMN